jgi:tetratricopeptide (TPR) repeat protein
MNSRLHGDTMGAMDQLRKSVELQPGLVEAHRERARIARASREWLTAAAELQALLAWEPGDAGAHDDLAAALEASGDAQEAVRERAAARKLDPKRS